MQTIQIRSFGSELKGELREELGGELRRELEGYLNFWHLCSFSIKSK